MMRCIIGLFFVAWLSQTSAQGDLTAPAIESIAEIVEVKNPSTLAGRRVVLPGVHVRKVLGRQVILVGSAEPKERPLLVRLTEPLQGLKAGSRVTVEGLINQTPVQLQTWDLNNTVAAIVKGHPIYVNASKARMLAGPAGSNPPPRT